MTLSDLIAVMRDGKLVQFGPQSEIYGKPRNTYVATFVGKPKMSLIDGDLQHRGDEVDFVGPGIRIGLGKTSALGLRNGATSVALGIRAEDVRIVNSDSPNTPGAFEATVQLLEPIGSDTFVELAAGPATIVGRIHPDLPIELGQLVRAEMSPSRVHLFERETGERIND
jgi:multiple sugar transport system ATP-binding protein